MEGEEIYEIMSDAYRLFSITQEVNRLFINPVDYEKLKLWLKSKPPFIKELIRFKDTTIIVTDEIEPGKIQIL